MARRLAGRRAPHVDQPLVAVFAGNHGVVAQGVSAFPAVGDAGDGRQFRRRRRGDQPDLQDLRPWPESLRTRAGASDRRHHAGAGARREGLRGDDGLRHGGDRRRRRSARASAKWGSATPPSPPRSISALCGGEAERLGRTRRRRRRRGAGAQGARGGAAPSRCIATHLDDPLEVLRRARRARNRGDGRRDSGGAHAAHSRDARRLRRLRGAAILHALDPAALDHCIAGACVGRERARAKCCAASARSRSSISACGSARVRGAALAAGVVKGALACHIGMATFAEAGVAGKQG